MTERNEDITITTTLSLRVARNLSEIARGIAMKGVSNREQDAEWARAAASLRGAIEDAENSP